MAEISFLYTATAPFSKTCAKDGLTWDSYIAWSKLTHVDEVVSLDTMLNASLVEPDYDNSDDWPFIHTDGAFITHLYTTLDYVLRKSKPGAIVNVLRVLINPAQPHRDSLVSDYQFMGYELLDQEYGTSALTNCSGFDETFLPTELNRYGLLDDFVKATDIRNRLLLNNPGEHHAHTHVMAVWRHKRIGRVGERKSVRAKAIRYVGFTHSLFHSFFKSVSVWLLRFRQAGHQRR